VDFTDKIALKSIYCSLVWPISEYGSVIWSPYQLGYKSKMEKVEQKCLRFISIKCSIPKETHTSYNLLLSTLHLKTLEQRRISLELCFLYKLLAGNVDFPDFLSRLLFYTSTLSTWSADTISLSLSVINYTNNTPWNRILQTINKLKI
jgi:hypothetical protein